MRAAHRGHSGPAFPGAPRRPLSSALLLPGAPVNEAPLGQGYEPQPFFDEMFEAPDAVRPHYRLLFDELRRLAPAGFQERRREADVQFLYQGITFTVYSASEGTERIFPFDLLPRVIPPAEWQRLERGLIQ